MTEILHNRALRILLMTNALIMIAGALLGPIYAIYVEEIGGDLLDAGMAGSVFAIAAGLTVLFAGKLGDESRDPRRVLVIGYAMMGLGYLLYMQVDSVMHLLMVQVLVGFGEALYLPSFDALYSRHLDGKKEGEEWGVWEAMNYFATGIGAAVGGYIAKEFGFMPLFILMAVLCFKSALYITFVPKRILS